jgi:hydroxyacylglutathione hydrolase
MLSMVFMNVHQIPARKDNYIYILDDPHLDHCAVIDATDAQKNRRLLPKNTKKKLSAIFVTHHHEDHINGIESLRVKYDCEVYGFKKDHHRIPGLTRFVIENDTISYGPHELSVLETPGHTLGHISYYNKKQRLLFCGDVLFRFGCGRLFEGSPEMMFETLKKISQLPQDTTIYCAHEYTIDNLEFCLKLEPTSAVLKQIYQDLKAQQTQNKPTVPFLLEEQINHSPFLRWNDPSLKESLKTPTATEIETFTKVRALRNNWSKTTRACPSI